MPERQGLKSWFVTLCVVLTLPSNALAECASDIIGKWQQSYVEFAGNKISDETQSWTFMTDGTVRFQKTQPEIDTSAEYSCDGDIIYMKGRLPGRLKIVSYDGDTMAWESLDRGGGITHVVRVN